MNEITSQVYVGDIHDAADHRSFRAHGVEAVLKLTHTDPERPYPEAVERHEVPMIDGPANDVGDLEAAVETLLALLDRDLTVLVHCAAGASRSATVAATAIAAGSERDLDEAVELVRERRPVSNPHPALLEQAETVLERL